MALLQNFTAPADWTDHGTPGLVCRPATWTSIAAFFVSNFVAHVFTIKQDPDQSASTTLLAGLATLCYPVFGLVKATSALLRSARSPFRSSQSALERAHNAGALCMLVWTER